VNALLVTPEQFKAWANVTNDVDDEAIRVGCAAASEAMRTTLRLPTDPDTGDELLSDDLALAARLRVLRYLSRRNSPDGLVGMGEVIARVPRVDVDIADLEGPYRIEVFG
jgi:hypothetical protein